MLSPLRTFFKKVTTNSLLSLKPKHLKRGLQALGLTLLLGLTYPLTKMQNKNHDNNNYKSSAPRNYNTTVVCDSSEISEGTFRCVDMPNGRKVIIVRFKGKLHAVGGECTYDNSSSLAEGVCFGDKLFCCHHGCAFDIQTGRVELPPALNDLPRFFVEEKNQKVILHTPFKMPIAIQPLAEGRDYTDLRKVVIVGNGMAALGCIDGLRQNGYTGEIQVITQETEYPYDQQVLLKSFTNRFRHSDRTSEMREPHDQKWYKDMGIQFIFNQDVIDIDAKEYYPYVLLNQQIQIEYDALLLASGTDPVVKRIPGLSKGENTIILQHKRDYDQLSKKLMKNQINDLVVLGYNTKSLRFIKTIHAEFPNINITVIDPNEKNQIQERLGPQLSLIFAEDAAHHGVKFYLRLPIQRVERNKEKMKVKMHLDQSIDTDLIVMFPNNEIGRSIYYQHSKRVELDMSKHGNLKMDNNCRTSNKQIFGAGKGATVHYFYGQQLLPCLNSRIAYQEGYTSAYNMLALNIPYHMIPFQSIQSIGKELKLVGYNSIYDDIHIIGSVQNWDFVAIYSVVGNIVGCAVTPSQKRVAGIFEEAFREQLLPRILQFKKGNYSIEKLQRAIRMNKKAGCYKDLIDSIRQTYKTNPRDILWMHRDVDGAGMRVADELNKKPSFVDKDGFVRDASR